MRHEQAIELKLHKVRDWFVWDQKTRWPVFTDVDIRFMSRHYFSASEISDFKLLESDYNWPAHWPTQRRMIAMYGSSSEFQLTQYLECYPAPPRNASDRFMNAVFGIQPVVYTQKLLFA